jgi:hypothetical protein
VVKGRALIPEISISEVRKAKKYKWLACIEIVELIRQPNPDQWICRLIKPISALDQPLAKSFGLPSDQVVVDVEQIEEIGDCEMSEINAMPRRSCVDLFTLPKQRSMRRW